MPLTSTTLWIVATPIGNPGDISDRARQTLAEADIILAEDTRRAGKLLKFCHVLPHKLLSFFEHNEEERQKQVLEALENGANVALITDAGTPLVADPGYRLVRACHQAGIRVSPVPGPCAPIAAICACGLPPLPFTFLGFLPRSLSGRENIFSQFAQIPCSLIFFERKDRLGETLRVACNILGDREIAICRELTKVHEEFIIGKLADHAVLGENLLGELTVIIGPYLNLPETPAEEVKSILQTKLDEGYSGREAVKMAKKMVQGWKTGDIYKLLINISS